MRNRLHGKGRVAFSCPFVSSDWIAAHGLEPSRISPAATGGEGGLALTAGLCPYMRAFVNGAMADPEIEAVVLTTMCDQMRRAADVTREKPLFLMNVPATWQSAAARDLYRSELARLGAFLETLGGRTPSDEQLTRVMHEHNERREALRAGRPDPQGIPIALLGGPLPESGDAIADILRQFGGSVVLDATETGERTWPAAFDRRRLREQPLEELVDAYFGSIPDPFRRPNSALYTWLDWALSERSVRGVVLIHHVWCDIWRGEVTRLRDWLKVPLMDMTMGEDSSMRHRLQAFMETLT